MEKRLQFWGTEIYKLAIQVFNSNLKDLGKETMLLNEKLLKNEANIEVIWV